MFEVLAFLLSKSRGCGLCVAYISTGGARERLATKREILLVSLTKLRLSKTVFFFSYNFIIKTTAQQSQWKKIMPLYQLFRRRNKTKSVFLTLISTLPYFK